MEKLLTCEQVAERYGVKVSTVWDWIRSERLPAVKINGRNYRIRAEDLAAFEQKTATGGGK